VVEVDLPAQELLDGQRGLVEAGAATQRARPAQVAQQALAVLHDGTGVLSERRRVEAPGAGRQAVALKSRPGRQVRRIGGVIIEAVHTQYCPRAGSVPRCADSTLTIARRSGRGQVRRDDRRAAFSTRPACAPAPLARVHGGAFHASGLHYRPTAGRKRVYHTWLKDAVTTIAVGRSYPLHSSAAT